MVERLTQATLEASLGLIYALDWPQDVRHVLLAPEGFGTTHTLEEAIAAVTNDAAQPLPRALLPLAVFDETSIACVVVDPEAFPAPAGTVVRFHLRGVGPDAQFEVVDVDPLLYLGSLSEELSARDEGRRRVLDEIGPAYEESHLAKEKRPRDYVVRPFRIACQNVIVGLGAIAQDSSFDGLSVVAWQTCEAPHVVAHEANRAMAALMLCDAFRNGGTMEIRFDRPARLLVNGKPVRYDGHPEGHVPASLHRFGRTVGVKVGSEDPAAIVPSEARQLFLAVTPMPAPLRERVEHAVELQGITPERLCFSLLSGVWRDIELDVILAASSRAASILAGGADWSDRAARQAESEVCRTAVMVDMIHRRLDATDTAGADGDVRVVEDRRRGVTWEVVPEMGAVRLSGLDPAARLPWALTDRRSDQLLVFARSAVTPWLLDSLARRSESEAVALVVPVDRRVPRIAPDVVLMRCPERLADIDKTIETKLLAARISR